jgi:hypothetical protein
VGMAPACTRYRSKFQVLRTFQWVKTVLFSVSSSRFSWKKPRFLWVELEAAAVKVDGDLHVLAIAVTIRVFLTAWIFEFSPSMVALVIR